MKLITFSTNTRSPSPGILLAGGVLPLNFKDMLDVLRADFQVLREYHSYHSRFSQELIIPLEEIQLHSPLIRPNSMRDFYAFEQHVSSAYANRGRGVPAAWYKYPVFYFTNHSAIFGPNDVIKYPDYTQALDYELEIACVIGKPGMDITENQAEEHIFGYTIMNDWSARDIQKQEMSVGLGPAKGKDFATTLGPWIVTKDELERRATGRSGTYDLAMVARINGEEKSRGNFRDIHYSMGALIAHASRGVMLFTGDVIASGTVGTGCILELTQGKGPWLKPGDMIELEIEFLGILRNYISSAPIQETNSDTKKLEVGK